MTELHLDRVDKDIIQVLSQDGRATYSEIAKVVGVSVGTVRNRIVEMRESGALHLNVWLDPYRVGLGVNAQFMIKVRPGSIEGVAASLSKLDQIGYIALIAGDHDITADAFCKDVPHLSSLLREGIETIDGVDRVTTYLVTEVKYASSMNIAGLLNGEQTDGAS